METFKKFEKLYKEFKGYIDQVAKADNHNDLSDLELKINAGLGQLGMGYNQLVYAAKDVTRVRRRELSQRPLSDVYDELKEPEPEPVEESVQEVTPEEPVEEPVEEVVKEVEPITELTEESAQEPSPEEFGEFEEKPAKKKTAKKKKAE